MLCGRGPNGGVRTEKSWNVRANTEYRILIPILLGPPILRCGRTDVTGVDMAADQISAGILITAIFLTLLVLANRK